MKEGSLVSIGSRGTCSIVDFKRTQVDKLGRWLWCSRSWLRLEGLALGGSENMMLYKRE